MRKLIFIAHRGAPLPSRRENSLQAFERAAASGRFAYIELDVRRTRTDDDGNRVPIVAHDATTDALYEQQRIPKYQRTHQGVELVSLTYEMLRADSLDVATLADTLRILNGHPVLLEVKTIEALPQALEVIHDFVNQVSSKWRFENFVISSFDWDILYKTKELVPDMAVSLLYGVKNLPRLPFKHIEALEVRSVHMSKWVAWFMAPYLKFRKVSARYVFTLNKAWQVKLFRYLGVNGVTTDSITLPEEF